MTATVYLIRHASHDRLGKVLCGRMPGVSLSAQGRNEAEAVARRLAREPIAALYCSPLERAVETAAPIADVLGLSCEPSDDLLEVDYGDWNGAAFAELEAEPLWRQWNEARASSLPPAGESMAQVQMRIGRFLNFASGTHAGRGIAAVTHGDVIKAAFAAALGLSLDNLHRLEVSPGSVSVLAVGDWGAKVLSMNEVPV